ncbi:MAG: hypothetical protein SNI51_03775, partial [Rikenellaceae bacterium]
MLKQLILSGATFALAVSCCTTAEQPSSGDYDKSKAAYYGVPAGNKLSSAMQRAMSWPEDRDN